jgi:hypothetical protein
MSAKIGRLYEDVAFLTCLRPYRNFANVRSLEKAAHYIQGEFEKAGATPETQEWVAWSHEYKNICISYHPEKTRRLVIGAHYDVAGEQPGADDNASGVAGLLELARLVFEQRPVVGHRIDFVAYCLEEPPFFASELMGSYIHASSLSQNKTDVLGMIGLEMIGYFSDEPFSQQYPAPELAEKYPHTANFIAVVGIAPYAGFNNEIHRLMASRSKIDVQVVSFPAGDSLAGLSDHRNYWKFGYPALMINDTSFVRNPNYHQKSDTIETLDFEKMAEVVNSLYYAVSNVT